MLKGIYILNRDAYEKIYAIDTRHQIAGLVDIIAPPQTAEMIRIDPSPLTEVDVIFSGWGMVKLDAIILGAAPNLKVVFYGSGSIRGFATDSAWDRGIRITSAYAANAVPVAEFTLAQIIFSLKRGWHYTSTIKNLGKYPPKVNVPGAYGSTVGIISLGMIGRMVAERLQKHDLNVIAYDPYVSEHEGAELGVKMCTLEDVFHHADVVSLHTPWLPETVGMITGKLIKSMKRGATLINTARGAIVNEQEMIEVLQKRQDLFAILDVTFPEPPEQGSPLYSMPNVVLTPHIAGSMDNECQRMGDYMFAELKRYLEGKPLQWEITREKASILA
jgi:phosphoglycerate dehydrogenase-like enzyme